MYSDFDIKLIFINLGVSTTTSDVSWLTLNLIIFQISQVGYLTISGSKKEDVETFQPSNVKAGVISAYGLDEEIYFVSKGFLN
ncbi:unnamed protein product, partial [Allacma fusca]